MRAEIINNYPRSRTIFVKIFEIPRPFLYDGIKTFDRKRTMRKKCDERSKTGSDDAETWTYLTGTRPE